MNRNSKPELLSPAGEMESVYAAVENGCSAIYLGSKQFSARRNAKNFTIGELEAAVDYCHLRGVKLYAAANTLIKDKEINRFLDFVESIYLIGADGIIVQDIGCASLINSCFPDFYLSASTQMTVHDADGAKFLTERGFDRVILSRELSLNEISGICKKTKADIECFVHGALCVCYSGQCLFSSFRGGRSGNRGDCAQPCRLNYGLNRSGKRISKGGILSPKDMTGLYALPALIDCGVKSFKIEGRMKSPEYVAAVTSIYRKYIDLYSDKPEKYTVDESDIIKLAAVFNRSGFNRGYFFDYSGKKMMTDANVGNTGVFAGIVQESDKGTLQFKTAFDLTPGDGIEIRGCKTGAYITNRYKAGNTAEIKLRSKIDVKKGTALYRTFDKKLMDELRASYASNKRKLEINGRFTAKEGKPASLRVWHGNIAAEAFGETPATALTTASTCAAVEKQLKKTGNTPFAFRGMDIDIDENLFINIGGINDMRRKALSALEGNIKAAYKRGLPRREPLFGANVINYKAKDKEYTVLVRTAEQLTAACEYDFYRLYVDFEPDQDSFEMINGMKKRGASVFKCLSRIQRESEAVVADDIYDGYLIRTYGQAQHIIGASYAVDYTLNAFNGRSIEFWMSGDCESVCASPELDATEIGQLPNPTEAVCYGKVPLMTTVQCPIGNFYSDKEAGRFCKNRNDGKRFEIIRDQSYALIPVCDKCYCLIMSPVPIFVKQGIPCSYNRLEFSDERYVDTRNIMSIYLKSNK